MEETISINLLAFQRQRFETLAETHGVLTQDVVTTLHSIIKSAMMAGRTHCLIQTLRIGKQFSYSSRAIQDAHPVLNAHTMAPFTKGAQWARLNGQMDPLLQWLRSQGIHFVCTTKQMERKLSFGQPSYAEFLHIEAVFIPEYTDLREQQGHVLAIWNTVYMSKCLDNSMISQWNQRALTAVRCGAGYFAVCTLYLESDYIEDNGELNHLACICPREHLSMRPLEPNPRWKLDSKFNTLVRWVLQLGYEWTLCCAVGEKDRVSNWAYFTVMLDPLEKYAE